jgi:hypothetical protein
MCAALAKWAFTETMRTNGTLSAVLATGSAAYRPSGSPPSCSAMLMAWSSASSLHYSTLRPGPDLSGAIDNLDHHYAFPIRDG